MSDEMRSGDRVVRDNRVGTIVGANTYRATVRWDDGTRMDQVPVGTLTRATLVRTNAGRMIHRQECAMARRGAAMPWLWADTVPRVELHLAIRRLGYRDCQVCNPIGRGHA